MSNPIVVAHVVAGALGVVAGLVAAASLVGPVRREDGPPVARTAVIGTLALAAILVGGAVLATLVAGREPDGAVFAALAVVLGALATTSRRGNGGPLSK